MTPPLSDLRAARRHLRLAHRVTISRGHTLRMTSGNVRELQRQLHERRTRLAELRRIHFHG